MRRLAVETNPEFLAIVLVDEARVGEEHAVSTEHFLAGTAEVSILGALCGEGKERGVKYGGMRAGGAWVGIL